MWRICTSCVICRLCETSAIHCVRGLLYNSNQFTALQHCHQPFVSSFSFYFPFLPSLVWSSTLGSYCCWLNSPPFFSLNYFHRYLAYSLCFWPPCKHKCGYLQFNVGSLMAAWLPSVICRTEVTSATFSCQKVEGICP
uniref:Putative secreted protein n=1 Tax=Amblyomma triste TaxID=251400 RepID=A0A023G2H0_AMBTT